MRGIAALGVVLMHCTIATKQQGAMFLLGFAGQRGVQLFYVVSAFTLYNSMIYRTHENNQLLNFYIRRFFRVAPLYYVAIILNLICMGLPPGLHVYDVILGFLFLNGFKPSTINSIAVGGWSVTIEATFYLILPLLFVYINNYKKALILIFVSTIIFFAIGRFAVHKLGMDYSEYFTFLFFPIEFPVFCIGILTFFVWKEIDQAKDSLAPYKKQISIMFLLFAGIIFLLSFPYSNRNMHLTSFGFLLLIIGLSQHSWKVFVNKFTLNLGKVSYSIYLLHFFVLLGVEFVMSHYFAAQQQRLEGKPVLMIIYFVAVLIGTIGVANVSFVLIEKFGINMGKRVIIYLKEKNSPSA